MIDLDQGGRHRGAVDLVPAPADLAGVVEFAWVDRGGAQAATGDRSWRVVPDPSGHLIFKVIEGEHDALDVRASVVGPRSVHRDIDVRQRVLTVGIRLRPAAIGCLWGGPADGLTDRSVPLSGLRLRVAREVSRRVEDASVDGRADLSRVMLREGLGLIRDALPAWDGVDGRVLSAWELVAGGASLSLGRVARRVGTSDRTLRTLMREQLGLGLKRASRIERLLGLLSSALASRRRWAELAAEAGYSDQPHMLRDARDLLGDTPARFLARGRRPASGGSAAVSSNPRRTSRDYPPAGPSL